jgi:hypothetical protein
MRKIYILLGFLITFSFYLTCESLILTKKEAVDLIRKERGLPISNDMEIVFRPDINTGLCLEFIRLINEGYLEVGKYEFECLRRGKLENKVFKSGAMEGAPIFFEQPIITEKGRSLIKYIYFRNGKGEIECILSTLMYDIKKIDEILYDKVNNLALVTYSCVYTPIDYFYLS